MRSFCKHSVLVSGGSLHCHCNVGDNVCYQPLSSHPQSSIKQVKIIKIFDMCYLYSSKLSVCFCRIENASVFIGCKNSNTFIQMSSLGLFKEKALSLQNV